MRKTIALLFLSIAGIVILAHSVIPHHHHYHGVVCVTELIGCLDCDHSSANEPEHPHNSKECIIKDIFSQSNNGRQIIPPCVELWKNTTDLCFSFFPEFLSDLTDLHGLPFRQKPYINNYHAIYAAHSLGLRAPPTCLA